MSTLGGTNRTSIAEEVKDSFTLVRQWHSDWPTYVEFFTAFEAADPLGIYSDIDRDGARGHLRRITEQARAESIPAMCQPARARIACFVGITRIAKRLPKTKAHRFSRHYLLALAQETPFMMDDAVVYSWKGDIRLERSPLPHMLELGHVQAMINEAGGRFCARIVTDYMEKGWRVSCMFPAFRRLIIGQSL